MYTVSNWFLVAFSCVPSKLNYNSTHHVFIPWIGAKYDIWIPKASSTLCQGSLLRGFLSWIFLHTLYASHALRLRLWPAAASAAFASSYGAFVESLIGSDRDLRIKAEDCTPLVACTAAPAPINSSCKASFEIVGFTYIWPCRDLI